MNIIALIYSFGLFFAGIYCLTQYSADFSKKKLKQSGNKSLTLTFLKSFGISAAAGSSTLVLYSASSFCRAGIIDFKTALVSSLGTIGSISACFMAVIDNRTIIYLILGIGGVMIFFTRKIQNEKIKTLFFFLFSIGLLLYGMDELKTTFAFIKTNNEIKSVIGRWHSNFLIFFFGGIISLLMQSGSATAFMAVGLYGGHIFTHEQTAWFIYGGTCLGSAIRSQLIAFSFRGSARRLLGMYSNKIFLIALIASILYFIQIYSKIPMINQIFRSIYDNIIFEVYGSMVAIELIIILCTLIFIKPIIRFYEKLYSDEPSEKLSKAVYLTNIESKPKEEWISLMEKESGEILCKFSELLSEYSSKKDISFINNVCNANAIVIEQMLDLHKKLFNTTNSNLFITGGIYEKLLILDRLNKEVNLLLETVNKSKIMMNDEIVDAVIQHLHLVFSELSSFIKNRKSDMDFLEYICKSVRDTKPRRDILENEFIFTDRKYGNDLKLEFIGSYYDSLHYLREIELCYEKSSLS